MVEGKIEKREPRTHAESVDHGLVHPMPRNREDRVPVVTVKDSCEVSCVGFHVYPAGYPIARHMSCFHSRYGMTRHLDPEDRPREIPVSRHTPGALDGEPLHNT